MSPLTLIARMQTIPRVLESQLIINKQSISILCQSLPDVFCGRSGSNENAFRQVASKQGSERIYTIRLNMRLALWGGGSPSDHQRTIKLSRMMPTAFRQQQSFPGLGPS